MVRIWGHTRARKKVINSYRVEGSMNLRKAKTTQPLWYGVNSAALSNFKW